MKKSCLLALTFAITYPVYAFAIDLLDVYKHAHDHDGRFAAARAAYEAGKEKRAQGLAQLRPTLTLSGSSTQNDASLAYRGTTTFEGGDRRFTTTEYELNLIQPLYRPQNWAAYRQGQAQADLAEAEFSNALQDLALRVAQAYFDLLAAEDQLALATAQKDAYFAQYEQARARLASGAAAITDVYEAKARMDFASAQEIAAANDVQLRQKALWKISGVKVETVANLRASLPLTGPKPNDINWWLEQADRQNPQVRALRQNLRVAEEELERTRGTYYPTLDLVASDSKSYSTGSIYTSAHSDVDVQSIGIKLQVPLYQGGYADSKVREAAANRDRAREELEDGRREIELQVQQAFLSVTGGARQVEALSAAVSSSESALEATRAGVAAGTRNFVDVLNATQQLYNAKRDYARARYDYLLAGLKLEAGEGTLDEDDLAEMNKYLSAE